MGETVQHNYYDILDVPVQASHSDVLFAYKRAKSTYSPGNPKIYEVFTKEEADAWNDLIEEAFHVIGNPQTRARYDQSFFKKAPRVVATDLFNFKNESPVEAPTKETVKPLKAGWARTPLSEYQINPDMESLIEKQDVFDGLFLKKIREYKAIDVNAFSKKTCIALRHLYAIENNNFSVLPAPVFVRGYIQQYCRILGLEESRVVKSFLSLLANESR